MVKTVFKLSVLSAFLFAASSGLAAGPSNAQLQKEIRAIMRLDQHLHSEVLMLKARLQDHKLTATGHNVVRRHSPSSVLQTTRRGATVLTDRFEHPITVTTSPLLGPATGGAGNVLEQGSKDNQQLTMIQQRAALMKFLRKEGDNDLYRPILELSGGLEGQLYGVDGYGKGAEPRGINLSTAEFDVNGVVGPWASGFMALDYDNSPVSSGNRQPKGTVFLDRGFVTLGNLNRFPLYVATGEMYVPYGRYGSLMLTTPITQSLARTKSDAAMVGFYRKGVYAELFGYNGEQISGTHHIFKQGGVDAGYKRKFGPNATDSFRVGASIESNMADSQGLQDTGANDNTGQFQGFEFNNANNIRHRVPAYALYGNLNYKNWAFITQFVSAFSSFNVNDLSFGDAGGALSGARPEAAHFEINYTVHFLNKPFTFGADYGQSWESLAANLPKRSYTADIQTSWFRNTLETIEYRHDDDYSNNKSASGAAATRLNGTGKTRNSYIAQLGAYF